MRPPLAVRLQGVVRRALEAAGFRAGPVWVSVSGGSDSVAALRLLHGLGLEVRAFHMDHQARPDSTRDADMVANLCATLGIPLEVSRVDVPAAARQLRQSFERTARTLRYERLQALAGDPGWVVTGHTMDDQAETVLLRLLRGAGSRGLGGIHPSRALGPARVVRPLLGVRRAELRHYLAALGQPWCEDASNQDCSICRNRIRHELLPLLASYNPNVVAGLAHTAEALRHDDACLSELAAQQDPRQFDGLAPALQRRVLLRLADTEDVAWAHLQGVAGLRRGHQAPWPGGRRLEMSAAGPCFIAEALCPTVEVAVPGRTPIPGLGMLETDWVPQAGPANPCEIFVQPDLGVQGLMVRARRDGDRFAPAGFGHQRKLKKFLGDEKVPRHLRDSIPILAAPSGQIVWIVGMRASHHAVVPDQGGPALRVRWTPEAGFPCDGDARASHKKDGREAELAQSLGKGGAMGASQQLDEIVVTADQIKARVAELGAQLSAEYAGREVFMVAILKGALVFIADLARHMACQVQIDFMVVSRHTPGGGEGEVRIIKDLDMPLAGRDVLLVEDIVDAGETMDFLVRSLRLREPASLKVVTLFQKQRARTAPSQADYVGFEVPERFLVGYGLDYGQKYRNLPYVAVLPPQGPPGDG